ncbi:MAG: SufD family Fe-S cluster assembly protein [Clostridia bacterium]|nr:SufD family Fe-S cluster assembly protein [Clostridia bacterium]
MKINFSPVLTSQNYGINFVTVEDGTFSKKVKPFSGTAAFAKDYLVERCDALPKDPLCNESLEQLKCSNTALKVVANSSDEPLIIKSHLDTTNNQMVGRLELVLNEDTKRDIIVLFESETPAYLNNFLHIVCKNGSTSNITILNDLAGCENYQTIEVETNENAMCNINIVDFCDSRSIIKSTTNLVGENSQAHIKMMYFVSNDGLLDINLSNNLLAKNCNTTINAVGAAANNAVKNFRGTIDFKQGSTKSFGSENELCLMLSQKAKVKALPMLLCHEEDVEGSHSTATGKIDTKALFYLMSRGLSKTDATKLIVKAKFNKILQDVNPEIQNHIINKIDRKLEENE